MYSERKYVEKTNDELLQLYKETQDIEIKNELVMRYLYIVKGIAIQMRDVYVGFSQLEDIVNEGVIVIMGAIDKFEIEKNVKFETYISKRIKGMIIDLARKQDWVPRSARKSARDIEETTQMLYNELGYMPSQEQICQSLDITVEKYQESMKKAALFNVLSLDMVLAEIMENQRSTQMPKSEEKEQPEQVILQKELSQVIADAIASMKAKEQQVISLYYMEELNMKQIASVMQVSEPRVSQIHASAIKKLKVYMEKIGE